MKCNQCGNENADTAAFCATCGAALQTSVPTEQPASQSVEPEPTAEPAPVAEPAPTIEPVAQPAPTPTPAPVSTPATTPASASASFNNLNASAEAKKKPVQTGLIIGCVIGAVVLVAVAALVIWFILSKSGGTQTLSCTQDGKVVTQSTALTYSKKSLSKMEYTIIVDTTVDEDDLTTSEAEEVMMAAFAAMAFAQYDGHDGIDYYYSEKTAITTISFTADLAKMKKDDVDELTEDVKDLSIDEAKAELVSQGYTCTVK